jgi:hypothetical protein
MIPILLGIGVLYWLSMQKNAAPPSAGGAEPVKQATYVPWSVHNDPSAAANNGGGDGSGVTNPITAFFGKFQRLFPGPVSETAPSGAGGQTIDPGASPAPAGESQSSALAAAPQTYPEYGDSHPALMADPRYWFLAVPVDVAIMDDNVSKAMSDTKSFDPTSAYLEASLGYAWSMDK